MEFLENSYFLLALTFIVFILARIINKRTGLILLNPILISVTVLILFLWLTGIPYETYTAGGGYVEFWLKPAVVALGVPLYRQLSTIRKQLLPILAAELAGCVAGIVSVVVVAQAMGATREVVLSLAAKSVTTPIAMEVTAAVGGIPPLTAAVVVCVGIFGGMTGFRVMTMTHIKSPMARGLAMGTAAHALGTSAAIDTGGHRYGAWASLGLTLNGLFTALLAPTILELLGA
ncbi:MAG: LrgB family protein [Bacteroides sp.]|nr:LrgB family protein [Bacteroides sp.]MBD5331853.1 LrgB family protein [Bacteroides sp.]MDE7459837.1 LrgB family protein [Paramuribaculum sp.]